MLYLKAIHGKTYTRWQDLCKIFRICKDTFYKIFDAKIALLKVCRDSWPRFASLKEDLAIMQKINAFFIIMDIIDIIVILVTLGSGTGLVIARKVATEAGEEIMEQSLKQIIKAAIKPAFIKTFKNVTKKVENYTVKTLTFDWNALFAI